MPHPLAAAIIEVDMGHLDRFGQGIGVDGEIVIVRTDLNAPRWQMFYRLVAAVMTEF